MKKKFFLSALLISLFSLAAAKPVQADTSIADIQKRGELVVGVKQDVPNFGYKDPKTGTYSGIETDLAKMVADELKVKIRYVPVTAQTRGPLLDNEQVDMDIATFTITDERKKLYNFTSPYYTDASGFLVNKSAKIKKIEDLNGKTIGVAQGSITQRLITELGKKKGLKFKFVELGSYPELITSLHAHRIDTFSVDRSILSGYTSKRTALLDDSFKPSDYGIVTKKSNTELNDYLDNLVTKWSKDGSLQKLYDRYKLKPSSHTAD
ncbi:transporter substrate-binding domain-containing protein [Streptococcus pneumoniae]|uniref:transporter substrate-binding domain-containing protein n=1 Tax=Streptococcus pneumoniae TaxID=1313 RepID=UPI0001BFDBC2|nr:transporter substrate-binding domain-containing protein [Streptococcus pneumoniae]MDD0787521.1 transporter substrate-binding domain-containing protein [Streptococcus pneumoniae]MDS2718801.1 transporter substrate-binding domain-containing protein [Streptococcus pneumoniae]MDS3156372.1 transporter substrate-binding domain-containing protein [Streptococcus pneumoniae]MDS5366079.1 transporter substrate-binding domain-containing protein [Streptococcus pneumoniae]MDS8343153.1 transporter substrat